MACCELETAGKGKLPRECSDWISHSSSPRVVTFCVEALSRSPQHWSSYSNYLREVVTICSTYSRWHDLERAKDMHASLAEKLDRFVDLMDANERDRRHQAAASTGAQVRLRDDLQDAMNGLKATMDMLAQHGTAVAHDLSAAIQRTLVTTQNDIRFSFGNISMDIYDQMAQRAQAIDQYISDSLQKHELSLMQSADRLNKVLTAAGVELSDGVQRFTYQLDELEGTISRSSELVVKNTNELKAATAVSSELSIVLAAQLSTVQEITLLQKEQIEKQRHTTDMLNEAVAKWSSASRFSPSGWLNATRSMALSLYRYAPIALRVAYAWRWTYDVPFLFSASSPLMALSAVALLSIARLVVKMLSWVLLGRARRKRYDYRRVSPTMPAYLYDLQA